MRSTILRVPDPTIRANVIRMLDVHPAILDDWEDQIALWTLWLRASARPETTIGLRTYQLRRFSTDIAVHLPPFRVTLDVLIAWLGFHEWSAETRRSYRAALRSFYGWAHATGRMDNNPGALLPPITPPRNRPRPTPEGVLRIALAGADARERLMLELAARAGLRRGEICKVRTTDLLEGEIPLLRVVGKGGHVRDVPLTGAVAARLRQLPTGYAFPGKIDGHLSAHRVGDIISARLGPGWTCHTLRHRFATCAYAAERDIRAVQELLGHAKLETTQIYTLVPEGALLAAVRAAA